MTQKARTGIATRADGPGVADSLGDEARGVGNLFGRLNLRQVRDLVRRTSDWPEESVVDLNNTDGGSTLLVCRPESSGPQQGLETGPESPLAAKGTVGTGQRVIRTQAELDALGFHCGIREIPADPMEFYPQIWEMGYQSGWCRVGRMFDPDDCSPNLPVMVLWDTHIDQSDIAEEPTE